jgi:hypothetical protein
MLRNTLAAAIALFGFAPGLASAAASDPTPALVKAYVDQLVQQCGALPPGAAAPQLVERVDLDGDKLDDYVVDAGRYPCPGRPAIAAAAGVQVTVFQGLAGGVASPVLQRATFGSHMVRDPATGRPTLWLTLGGSDCGGASNDERCERRVVWQAEGRRFELMTPARTR